MKWTVPEDVLPAFVAEMDFSVAGPVQEALERVLDLQDYGYPVEGQAPAESRVVAAFENRMARLYGWMPAPGQTVVVSDLIQGVGCALAALTERGDGVLLHMPSYPPFRGVMQDIGRRLVAVPMRDDGTGYSFDLDALDPAALRGARAFVLCNPQNPTGRVFTRAELVRVAEFAIAHDLIVLSDEIHSDLVFAGHRHIPFASLGEDIARRTITLNSATKGFNIPGLRCGIAHFGSAELLSAFRRAFPSRLMGHPSIFGIEATVAAWTHGDAWLDAVGAKLSAARDYAYKRLTANDTGVVMHLPQATYLAWLDCRALNLDGPAQEFFAVRAGVKLSAGETFDPDCPGFVRLNFACSQETLTAIIDRMLASIEALQRRGD